MAHAPIPPASPRPGPGSVPIARRVIASFVALATVVLLGVAAGLRPSPTGVGTHLQLGLYKCGWITAFGRPCPTCGMTTAFAHAAHGNLARSFVAQPMGAALALGTSVAFWAALYVALTGSDLGRVCGNLLRPRVLWLTAGAAALAWAYKMLTWAPP